MSTTITDADIRECLHFVSLTCEERVKLMKALMKTREYRPWCDEDVITLAETRGFVEKIPVARDDIREGDIVLAATPGDAPYEPQKIALSDLNKKIELTAAGRVFLGS